MDTKLREFEEHERQREELGIEQQHVLEPLAKEEVFEIPWKIQEYRQSQRKTNADTTGTKSPPYFMWQHFTHWVYQFQLIIPKIKGRKLDFQWAVGISAMITAYLISRKWGK